jgi:hypothetical protein
LVAHRVTFGYKAALSGPRDPERAMFLMLSKKPRRVNRTKSKRFRAKLKAKNRNRRNRVYNRAK